ncbi:APC family permease [Polluticaenibacter yanchengensis]|uniref:Amino acid permease n=1 Tax=Polluticaenibacter yanchengensis TaxID=3014562 RepID=A0ABT4UNH5_9BACT|nr:amino acid permease [Chitinophagaceae bacterium LY-5]
MKQKTELKTFDVTIIIISLVIGMGIFRTPHDVARDAVSQYIFFAAWIFGGLIALCGALTFAEIGSRYPVTGGFYKIYSYCFHPAIAFMINCLILISNAASISAVALIGAGYLQSILPEAYHAAGYKQLIAISAILVFFVVNYLGLKMSVRTQNFLMVTKIGILLAICIGAFYSGSQPIHEADKIVINKATQSWETIDYIRALGIAMIAVSFSYGGYQQTINFGGEVHNPQKTIPRAIITGIIIILAFYLLVNYSYYNVLGMEGMKANKNDLAARHMQTMFGSTAYNIMCFLLFFSVLAYVNIGLMSNPRVMYAMAEDNVLHPSFAKQNQKQVLTFSLPVFTAISVLTLIFSSEVETILDRVIFLDSIGLATAVASIFILRKKTKHLDEQNTPIFKMKLYPFIPIFYIVAFLFITVSILIKDPFAGIIGGGLMLFFFVMYKLLTSTNIKRT